MRILHIISSADPKLGGPIQGIRNYETILKDVYVETSLLCFNDLEDTWKWEFPPTLRIIALGKSKTNWQYNGRLVSWLKENIHNYDKIILNGMWTYHTFATVKVIKELKRKKCLKTIPEVFLMPHGMLDPWFQKAQKRRLKAIRNYIYWHLIEKHTVNMVDGLLFTCQEELLLSRKSFKGYHPKRELNIGFGIGKPPAFNQELVNSFLNDFNLLPTKSYFLFLSRIDHKKGLDILVQAYILILKNFKLNLIPDLVIAGHGIDSLFGKALLNLINDNPILKGKLFFVGQLSGDIKWGAIYGCEAFVLPSHQENFGIAIVEALSCSKPVLITHKVNIYKEILDGGGGIINEDSLAGTYKSLTEWVEMSNYKKQNMTIKAINIYKKCFTMEQSALNLIKTLKISV